MRVESLDLVFDSLDFPELVDTIVVIREDESKSPKTYKAHRGRSTSADGKGEQQVFTWSWSVQVLCLIFIRAKLLAESDTDPASSEKFVTVLGPDSDRHGEKQNRGKERANEKLGKGVARRFEDALWVNPTWLRRIFGNELGKIRRLSGLIERYRSGTPQLEIRVDLTAINPDVIKVRVGNNEINDSEIKFVEEKLASMLEVKPLTDRAISPPDNWLSSRELWDEFQELKISRNEFESWIEIWQEEVAEISRQVFDNESTVSILENISLIARSAPSIITRSDCELFGGSYPRFGIRVYLNEKLRSFANIRKLPLVQTAIPRNWSARRALAERQIPEVERVDIPWENPHTVSRRGSLVADCVLEVPERYRKPGWKILSRELGIPYGEGRPLRGTPYVKGIEFSGLCAQAVCFMVNILLADEARGVFGISEITALASDRNLEEFLLHGLTIRQICDYFSNPEVNLEATCQFPMASELVEEEWVATVLDSYLGSGFPVILPVDLNLMLDLGPNADRTPIYEDAENAQPTRGTELHCVCVLGFNEEESGKSYVFHDPSYRPYSVASANDLTFVMARFPEVGDTDDDSMVVTPPAVSSGRFPVCIPVTAPDVKLPLAHKGTYRGEFSKGREKIELRQNGLLFFAESIQARLANGEFISRLANKHLNPGEFLPPLDSRCRPKYRLINLTLDVKASHFHALGLSNSRFIEIVKRVMSGHSESSLDEGWVWLQWWENFVWIWDAELDVSNLTGSAPIIAEALLLGVVSTDTGGCAFWERKPSGNARVREKRSGGTRGNVERGTWSNIKGIALISSFSTKGLESAVDMWPDGLASMELYGFMNSDVGRIIVPACEDAGIELPSNLPMLAMRVMHYLSDSESALESVADRIHSLVRRKEIDIRSISSFVPEITSVENYITAEGNRCLSGIGAIRFLIRLAARLRERGHEINTVEMVGGSRIHGVFAGIRSIIDEVRNRKFYTDVLVANLRSRDEARERLLRSVSELSRIAEKEDMTLLYELEPGPHFILNSIEELVLFSKELKGMEFGDSVGLNLDIGHWGFVLGIDPNEILNEPGIISLIAGAHCSDHTKGHFGDIPVGDVCGLSDYSPWFDVVDRAYGNNPKTSGVISLELEAIRETELISRSIENLREWLDLDFRGLRHDVVRKTVR